MVQNGKQDLQHEFSEDLMAIGSEVKNRRYETRGGGGATRVVLATGFVAESRVRPVWIGGVVARSFS